MNLKNKSKILFLLLILALISSSLVAQKSDKFTVIIDPGHGGKDCGAKYHGNMEKDINLDIALKVGKIIEQNNDINVIYTRKSDVFIELRERAKIANRNNANLFVSIHCNANKNSAASGSETYVMGMARANMNFEVSKAENSVIFLEDNYKQSYKGFDPNNPETLIGLKMVQENNLTSSIDLATKIQNNFEKFEIKSRGVKQEPLWVLDASVMPGVLVEIGFISNVNEAERLTSSEGQNNCAQSIAKAIEAYKQEYYGEGSVDFFPDKPTKAAVIKEEVIYPKAVENSTENGISFKIQIAASNKKIETKPKNFKGLKNITFVKESGNFYRYMYGETSSYENAKDNLEEAKRKGYKSAYMLAFKDGKKIDLKDAIK